MGPDQRAAEPRALYVADGDGFVPTSYTGGPWSPEHQFGGAAAALLATAVERLPTLVPQQVARLTVDLMRPVPVHPARPIDVPARVVREGKRVQVAEAAIVADGIEVARCSALRMRIGDLGGLDVPGGDPRLGPPGDVAPTHGPYEGTAPPGVSRAASFAFEHPGRPFVDPTWVRMEVAVVAGRETSPLARLAFFADFVSGIGHPRQLPVSGINADITLNVVRYPADDWLCLSGNGWTSRAGVGISQALLSDSGGVAAVASLSRLVDRRAPAGRVEVPDDAGIADDAALCAPAGAGETR